ncbi:MAG: hypothetical protein KF752_08510 [Pirellulaceae bacterium]|nr:hypothetical protein [Pirellulaceae bacterium]
MSSIDPLGWFYWFLSRMQRLGELLARPFMAAYEMLFVGGMKFASAFVSTARFAARIRQALVLQTLLASIFGLWNVIVQVLQLAGKTGGRWLGAIHVLYQHVLDVPKKHFQRAYRSLNKSTWFKLLLGGWNLFAHFLVVEPARWTVHIAELSYRWARSRKWRQILKLSMPTFLLSAVSMLVWWGSILDRSILAKRYLDIGTAEAVASTTDTQTSAVQFSKSLTNYGELAFRRICQIYPGDFGQIVVSDALIRSGVVEDAQRILSRLAPRDRIGNIRAHALLAMLEMSGHTQTPESLRVAEFQHHAEIGIRWSEAPISLLLTLAELYWSNQSFTAALELLEYAALREPSVYCMIVQRAKSIHQHAEAERVRKKGVAAFKKLLESQPANEFVVAQLAELLSHNEREIVEAQKLLADRVRVAASPILTRALSDVYLAKFTVRMNQGETLRAALRYLDAALAADPSSWRVAEKFMELARIGLQTPAGDVLESNDLTADLNDILADGYSVLGAHALLAEHHLLQNEMQQVQMHLEQVVQRVAGAARYASLLARMYLELQDAESARRVANNALIKLQNQQALAERYVDDLMDSLGMAHTQLGNTAEAVNAYELAIRTNPNRVETRTRLAELYRSLGNLERANSLEMEIDAMNRQANSESVLGDQTRGIAAPFGASSTPAKSSTGHFPQPPFQ